MLTIAILEDDLLQQQQLLDLLPSVISEPYTVTTFSTYALFYYELHTLHHSFDLAFLDIELNDTKHISSKKIEDDFNGIIAAQKATFYCPNIQIIFISQYLNYVSSVYETQHTYFIYKPELSHYLKPAVEKALSSLENNHPQILHITWNRESYYVVTSQIIYCERVLRTTVICTSTGLFNTSKKLDELLSELDNHLVRCHRSFVVNLNYLSSFNDTSLHLTTGTVIPISRTYLHTVRDKIAKYFSSI